ncbi:MAG: PP2C family protein-serine/threonine phosphatase [Phycisphaerales bacterium]
MRAAIDHIPEARETARAIGCMEVWGGHDGFSGAVSVPGNDVFVSCMPCFGDEQGGDVYYVSNCAAGLITRFVLADVSGHGHEVSGIARCLRDLMRRHINRADQSRLAMALNREFGRAGHAGRFATAVLLTYFAPTDHLILCNAGHPRPLFYSAAVREWRLLDGETPGVDASGHPEDVGIANLPLGILHPTNYEQVALPLGPGDVIVLYSDALIEAETANGPLGEQGLLRLAQRLDPARPESLPDCLRAEVCAAAGAGSLDDDATVIVLHHNGSDPDRPGLVERATILARMLGLR